MSSLQGRSSPLTLGANRSPKASPRPTPTSKGFPTQGTILVADDVGINRNITEMNVRRFFGKGWVCTTVGTAEAAVEESAAQPFDVIIMDEIFQGGMRGTEAIQLIRKAEATRKGQQTTAVIISCTGQGEYAGADTFFLNAGADAVWGKPQPNAADGTMQKALALELMKRQSKDLAASSGTRDMEEQPTIPTSLPEKHNADATSDTGQPWLGVVLVASALALALSVGWVKRSR